MFTIEELKRKTKENGLTYADLSEASGVPQNSINQIFRGREYLTLDIVQYVPLCVRLDWITNCQRIHLLAMREFMSL